MSLLLEVVALALLPASPLVFQAPEAFARDRCLQVLAFAAAVPAGTAQMPALLPH
jgi:hypothetical protein